MTNQLAIKEVKIEKLFGYYTYNIPGENIEDISRLMLVYGDNGSGKTTILKMIFWLLSSKDRSGFKSQIAATKFKEFSITFMNGIQIGASREKNNLIGGYTYFVNNNSEPVYTISLKTRPDNSINLGTGTKEDKLFRQILNFIAGLKISVFYLSDDRRIFNSITSDLYEPESYEHRILEDSIVFSGLNNYSRLNERKIKEDKKLAVEPAIQGLYEWIRTKVITGSRTGEKQSQVIFTDLIKNVFKSTIEINETKSKTGLIKEIDLVANKIKPYVSLGLIDKFDSTTIKNTIKLSNDERLLQSLQNIIIPYLESINVKLEALEKLKNTLYLFIESINKYFSNKIISFTLNKGFTLKQVGGDVIDFDLLSSGEKQLLLLFINTITSAEVATVFIIDEPEISLNIKWQRNLIDTLLEFSEEKDVQFILATHSLELLTSNFEKVTQLKNHASGAQEKI